MSYRKFGRNDFFTNTARTFPKVNFYIHNGKVFYNNVPEQSGIRNKTGDITIPQVPPSPDGSEFNTGKTVANTNDFKNVRSVGSGFISLYEYNIDRPNVATDRIVGSFDRLYATSSLDGTPVNVTAYSARKIFYDNENIPVDFVQDLGIIYPFITKDGARASWKTVTDTAYDTSFKYGDVLTATYPLSASVSREYIDTPSSSLDVDGRLPDDEGYLGATFNAHYMALRNRLNFYGYKSRHYKVTSSFGNKNQQVLNLISVPSIFYGTQINPGSISLKFYISGSLIGELKDFKKNGELIQTGPVGSTGSGSVAGVVMYDEGFILLTGSWDLNHQEFGFIGDGTSTKKPQWIYYGTGMNDFTGSSNTSADTGGTGVSSLSSASFDMTFQGHTETQVMTMFAHAGKGQVNYSNNPTFLQYGQSRNEITSSHIYEQKSDILIKNIVSSSYTNYSAPFKRLVYVSKIGVYDQNKNLIGIASLSNPVLKQDKDDITFKLKLDV